MSKVLPFSGLSVISSSKEMSDKINSTMAKVGVPHGLATQRVVNSASEGTLTSKRLTSYLVYHPQEVHAWTLGPAGIPSWGLLAQRFSWSDTGC